MDARAERLRAAHTEAVAEIERIRHRPGQLTTGINEEVGRSILEAGVRALADVPDNAEPKQFVVAAPPGTGKTSHAIALMAAAVRIADKNNVVDQIRKADDMYCQINELLPGRAAVWTSDHDVNSTNPTPTNVLTATIKGRVLPNLGWRCEAQKGRGGGSRFVKTGDGVLSWQAISELSDGYYGQSPKDYQGNDCN